MNKTSIEWVRNPDGTQGFTSNVITGCLNHGNGLCKGGGFPCYAYKLANGRLKPLYLANMNCPTSVDFRNGEYKPDADAYLDPFYPRLWEERLEISHTRRFHRISERQRYRDRGIFVCDMGELFGDWIPSYWQEQVFQQIKQCPNDRFYLLTKQPQNLIKFSPFPDNCWVGVTATNQELLIDGLDALHRIEAKIKYISFEPLLEAMNGGECEGKRLDGIAEDIDWLIIGACTGTYGEMANLADRLHPNWHEAEFVKAMRIKELGRKYTLQPKIEWVREIVEAADKAGVKVFLKDNLEPLWTLENSREPFFKFSRVSPGATSVGRLRQELPE